MRDDTIKLDLASAGEATERPISIAIVAMGGQGGGVLTGWIVDLAESQGWVGQSTSVPGVAQRTGATIYYVEMMKAQENGRHPILAQMPTPGDVDVVIAAEFMEAGRSILRGLVTPDRTTLIASNHRALAVTEKMPPGMGVADSGAVDDAVGVTAKQKIIFDMNELAVRNGSVISASMFGSLAASGALPFTRESYHEVIRKGGKGVEASIRAFDAAYDRTLKGPDPVEAPTDDGKLAPVPAKLASRKADRLLQRLRSELPEAVQPMAFAGLKKVVAFQDIAYGDEYLDLLAGIHAADKQAGGASHDWLFTSEAAKYIANAMAYDDLMRVADLKTRKARRDRIAGELKVKDNQILQTTEFMHPRMEEVSSVLPAGFARWLRSRKGLHAWLDRRVDKGRHVNTYSLRWFVALYIVARWKGMRRVSLRHVNEVAHRDEWLDNAKRGMAIDYDLGVEILRFRRLIKGYSDTHERGQAKFDKVMNTTLGLLERDDAAKWAQLLRLAAVKDPEQKSLNETIKTIETLP